MTEHAVGIVGVGRLGEAVASALLSDSGLPALYVTPRSSDRVARLVAQDRRVKVAEPRVVLHHCDVVLIALGAADARDVLPELEFESRHRIVSLMAEMGLSELDSLTEAAGHRCRLLALPSVADGGQTLPVHPRIPAVEALFGKTNTLIAAETEEQLIAFWSITALLSSIIMVGEVAAEWLERTGVEATTAEIYARALFADVQSSVTGGLKAGAQKVATPGGLNVMMRQRLTDAGLSAEIERGLDQVYRRLTEGELSSTRPSCSVVLDGGH